VPRYFFNIKVSDGELKDDPHGANLPDVAAALSYAEQTIRELKVEIGYDDPRKLMMIVVDDARKVVLALPFAPGCA
jgi:hypothetical protein